MYNTFTRGLIVGAIIGAAIGIMTPKRTNARLRRKVFKNSSHFIKRAGNMIDNIMD